MTSKAREFRVIGQRVPKVDAVAKVTGTAQFAADVMLPRLLTAKVLRSPHAHALIKRIDTSRAAAHPGVMAVITGSDLREPAPTSHAEEASAEAPKHFALWKVMATERTLFHGHAVAAVAAVSGDVAEEALDLIDVEYETLPHVLDPVEAMQSEETVLHEGLGGTGGSGNVAEHLALGRGDVRAGFADADVTVERNFRTQTVHQGYIEPDAETVYVHQDGQIDVWSSTQGLFSTKEELATVLRVSPSVITVIPTEVGGGFGGKDSVRGSTMCAILSRKSGHPVRLALTREEVLRATGPGNSTVSRIKVGARNDGTITAIEAELVFDAGAFPGAPISSAVRRVFSHYRTPNLKADAYDVVTNKPNISFYRAPGATPTAFALESVVDEVAEKLGLDPLEFRLKNVSRPGDPMPDGVVLPTVSLAELLVQVREHPCWTSPLGGPNRGRGLALGLWTMPGGTTSCQLNLATDGTVALVLGTVDLSSTRTSLAMVAAEALELDFEDVRVVMGDTNTASYSESTGGDKITYVTSKAVHEASQDLLHKLKKRAAEGFGVPPEQVIYERKRFWVEDAPTIETSLADLAHRTTQDEGAVTGFGSVSVATGGVAIAPNAAAHVVDVEVDRETGKVDLLRYTTFQDVGLSINPGQVEGQMQGGATQGIGWALSEEYDYDEAGVMRNASLLDYRLPTALDVPFIETVVAEIPSDDHPYGVRATGQVPIVPPAGAIGNAIYRAIDVRLSQLPMKPETVYRALSDAAGEVKTD